MEIPWLATPRVRSDGANLARHPARAFLATRHTQAHPAEPTLKLLDAAIIAAAQAVEHYEITRYGSLIAWANKLGRSDAAKVLEQTLNEEKAADKKLTSVAENQVNWKAAS
jgi:ferritin-like metal-binding protein YciE